MGLGIFNRNRKSFIAPPAPFAQPLELRVLVDAGPAARDAFTISVSPEGTVDSIREAVAAHIGRTAIALFKVSSVPCMAHLRFPASPLSLWYERQWPIVPCASVPLLECDERTLSRIGIWQAKQPNLTNAVMTARGALKD